MFSDIKAMIESCNSFAILTHKSADGDCLGSAYALKSALLSMGKNAFVYAENEDNKRLLKVLCGTDDIFSDSDCVIAVDCGDEERLGSRKDYFFSHKNKINIDHHPTNTHYGDLNYVDSNAAATGEIIFKLINFLGVKMTPEIATDLYVAIASDSGGFAFSNTTSETMRIAGELLKFDFPHDEIYSYLFNTNTIGALRLMATALSSLRTYEEGKISLLSVTMDDIKNAGATVEEAGKLIDMARTLDTADIAISLRGIDEGTKVSFRSKGADVSEIATRLGGGGHKRAAACVVKLSLAEAEELVVNEAKKLL